MRGMVASTYIGTANWSPWVVPSSEYRVKSSTNSSMVCQYMLIRTVANEGQMCLMLCSAASLLRELKALLASTSSNASVSPTEMCLS